jgi:[ribosomal protein S5]-alanine N-acetyltransferase
VGPEHSTRDSGVSSRGEGECRRVPAAALCAAVVVRSDVERLIGSIELRVVSCGHRGEIGYVLARESWGHGYATEATYRLLAFGFNELGLHKISATCDPENRASVAVLTKCGMHQEGVLRDHAYVRGEWRDRLLLSVIA